MFLLYLGLFLGVLAFIGAVGIRRDDGYFSEGPQCTHCSEVEENHTCNRKVLVQCYICGWTEADSYGNCPKHGTILAKRKLA